MTRPDDNQKDLTHDYVGEVLEVKLTQLVQGQWQLSFPDESVGFIPASDFVEAPKAGQSIRVLVEGVFRNGHWRCSLSKLPYIELWRHLNALQQQQADVEVEVLAQRGQSLLCELEGLAALMPQRQISLRSEHEDLASYVGKRLKARILKMSDKEGNIVVSHRAAIEKVELEARERFLAQLQVGQRYQGQIKQVTDYGVFVELAHGVEGLVHRSNLSWQNAAPSELVTTGESLDVLIQSIENGRIALDHKSLVEDDWPTRVAALKIGEVYRAHVTTLTNFGAFVILDNKMDGLIHNSELSWQSHIQQARQVLKLQDEIDVRLIDIDHERRRLRLSLKRVSDNPWESLEARYPIGSQQRLKVSGIADFGLFVELGEGLKGLIHQRDIQWENAQDKASLQERFAIGQELDCLCLSIDVGNARANFGLKQLSLDPWQAFVEESPVGKRYHARIKRLAKFGAFAVLENGLEGLIHISELAPRRVQSPSEVVCENQEVDVVVIKLDLPKRRLGLSMTAEPFQNKEEDGEAGESSALEIHEEGRASLATLLPDRLKH